MPVKKRSGARVLYTRKPMRSRSKAWGEYPGGSLDARRKEDTLITTWIFNPLGPTPHNQPGFLRVSLGRQGSREAGRRVWFNYPHG